ncbi:acyl transferase [Lacibacter sediminis]|uniref:Acyl transferase n=1 Tax=Lacibacter sediminis TaxID=2760713 RepID=A0A7G5XMH5_9BACT|nr:acyl transferase [Lacibacter sediminis]
MPSFVNNLFELSRTSFNEVVQQSFQFQYCNNSVYRSFCEALHIAPPGVSGIETVPFLPISFFKTHRIKSTEFTPETLFESSGTSQTIQSKHYVKSLALYEEAFTRGFLQQYDLPENYCFLGLLPSYLERGHSSLVYMVQKLIEKSNHPMNGFYLNNFQELYNRLQLLEKEGQPTILIGVTFGLLDFAEQYQLPLMNTIIMETGGMKGRREEMTREQVHLQLKKSFSAETIHSEYGMTELLSQAYSKGNGIFHCPPWMKVLVRDEDDPLHISTTGKGAINIIDLANVYSVSFIATDDVGEVFEDGSFRILGRMDNSDIRGCSLLAL